MMSLVMAVDLLFRDPQTPLHPIALLGRTIQLLEKWLYRDSIFSGGLLYLATVGLTAGLAWGLELHAPLVLQLIVVYFGLSSRSLISALSDVRRPLQQGDLETGRRQLSMIVTRRTGEMSEEEVVRSTLESGAENFADGIVGPYFFLVLGAALGHPLVCLAVFKATSTLDSMVGYLNPRYRRFGTISAKMDDVLMAVPARLAAGVLLVVAVLTGSDTARGWRIFLRDRRKTPSPNSGMTESLVAGLLGVRFGGAVNYGGVVSNNPEIGDPIEPVTYEKIKALERLIAGASWLMLGGMACVELFIQAPWR